MLKLLSYIILQQVVQNHIDHQSKFFEIYKKKFIIAYLIWVIYSELAGELFMQMVGNGFMVKGNWVSGKF